MPLSAYTVTGPVAPLTQSFAKRMVAKYVSGGVIVFDETNLRNRYTLMKKFALTVQVQDTPSQVIKSSSTTKPGIGSRVVSRMSMAR